MKCCDPLDGRWSLVLLAALVLGDVVNVLGEAIEVFALLLELLAESEELLTLTLTDGHVLAGLLAALPRVSATGLGGSTSCALRHDASGGAEGCPKGTEGGCLCEGRAEHLDCENEDSREGCVEWRSE